VGKKMVIDMTWLGGMKNQLLFSWYKSEAIQGEKS
jgi:hypothetical protein